VNGDTVLVGAFREDQARPGHLNSESSGSAYVFVRNGTSWTEQAKLHPIQAPGGGLFGISVALNGDTALIGSRSTTAAYVYVRSGTSWILRQTLTASDAGASNSVALSGDTALIGAYSDYNTRGRYGSAYVFVRNGASWSQQGRLTASDAAADDAFGVSVALSG
jgi:hypothetical protein